MPDPAIAEASRAFLGGPPENVERVGSGRNSGVYRLRRNGKSYALKIFPPRGEDRHNRFEIEFGALDFMARHGIDNVPRILGADAGRGYILLNWLEGEPVVEPREEEIGQSVRFLGAIHGLRGADGASVLPLAAEACLSGMEIVAQIERWLRRLEAVAGAEPALDSFLDGEARPFLAAAAEIAKAGYRELGCGFDALLPDAKRSLCPSDFGFHNALRGTSGRLLFLDFDYFGWDDPAKLVSDFLLHPGMSMADPLKRRFVAGALEIYAADREFPGRLNLLYSLFGLRWCMILLNEFLPERWAIRLHAGATVDWTAAKEAQLDRAVELLHSLNANFRHFPYGG